MKSIKTKITTAWIFDVVTNRPLRYIDRKEIRAFTETDTDVVINLWRATELVHPNNDPHRDIARKVADSPW